MQARQLRLIAGIAGALLAGAYAVLFLPAAYFRFDDFWQLNGSAVNALPLGELLTLSNAADGRWNPGMRFVLWLIGRGAGVDAAWPFYAALLATHALNIFLAVRIAAALGLDARGRWATALVGIAGLNFSAYSLVSIFLLHGVVSVSFSLMAVLAAARYAEDRKGWRLLACTAATLAGLLCKEYALAAPLVAAVVAFEASRGPRVEPRLWGALVLAFAAAGAALAAAYALAGAPLVPERGRYVLAIGPHVARNLVWLAAHTGIWLTIPAMIAWRHAGPVAARRAILFGAAMALAAALPTLLLRWQSPGHLYFALFATAIGAGRLASLSNPSSPGVWRAWAAVAAAVVVAVTMAFARRDVLTWGPITRQALIDWKAQRRPGDQRTIFFDGDNFAAYGGVIRMIGPGLRLRSALEFASGESVHDAAICISIIEGPKYEWRPGDALFLHSGGRLTRVEAPPIVPAYCIP